MNEKCRGCFSGELNTTNRCTGLLGTTTVGTETEVFFVQTCPNTEKRNQPETFVELQSNGAGVIVVYENTILSHEKAILLARAHQL